jgi:hypothetical protein
MRLLLIQDEKEVVVDDSCSTRLMHTVRGASYSVAEGQER